jgi:hypothetical protein
MISGYGVNQLHIYPKPIATTLHRTFEHIANVQLAANLPEINCFAFVGECGLSADHK